MHNRGALHKYSLCPAMETDFEKKLLDFETIRT
jgi:hypothetical protein